ncbi:MAG TPA: Hsp20/alpha crystallin family protein [Candidatus Nanopelagicales bacterium]|nr:Hsp20/alpha crystallin family protein [Candidatus Nanopelagicales bacterium]
MSTERTLTNREESRSEAIQQRPAVAPLCDVYESADELLVVADLPGVIEDGLTINLEKSELTIEARRADAAQVGPETDAGSLWDYRRSFVLPKGVDADKISADLKDGVLRVHLPKAASLKPRQIQVRAG